MFIASFFVLGWDFWDKVRALFDYGAKVQIVARSEWARAPWDQRLPTTAVAVDTVGRFRQIKSRNAYNHRMALAR